MYIQFFPCDVTRQPAQELAWEQMRSQFPTGSPPVGTLPSKDRILLQQAVKMRWHLLLEATKKRIKLSTVVEGAELYRTMKPPSDMCQFCLSNGESEEQCRSHQLRTDSGLVSCPILRAFVCPHCKASGDFAHTQSYCPLVKDGKFKIYGASLTQLKKKKNSAGKTGRIGRLPLPRSFPVSPPAPRPVQLQLQPSTALSSKSPPGNLMYDMTVQPASYQLSLYRHYQYLCYYR